MLPNCNADLWEYLAATDRPIVMYGMGNGADKILAVCEEKGIFVSDFFASDGFVRGHLFHGKSVLTWSETKERYAAKMPIVLLSFGTSRPEVLENIDRIAGETELYAPDVPAFGNGLFDRTFYETHKKELAETYSMFSDDESRRIFENVLQYKLTGRIDCLRNAESDPDEMMKYLVCPNEISAAADLGAYNGDTVRELLNAANGNVSKIWAFEPDARNFKKLALYASEETRAEIIPVHAGAWNEDTILSFDASGNRNASFGTNRSDILSDRPAKMKTIDAKRLDSILGGARVDYIKYDVEGAEREALLGSSETINAHHPTLMVSLYHRNEDMFALPLLIKKQFPAYKHFYLRRLRGIPAWDLNLYCK